jgi:hypothetical protein
VEPLAGEYGWAGDKSLDAFLRRGSTQLHTSHPTVMTPLSLVQRYSPRLVSSAISVTSPRWLIPTQGPKSCGQSAKVPVVCCRPGSQLMWTFFGRRAGSGDAGSPSAGLCAGSGDNLTSAPPPTPEPMQLVSCSAVHVLVLAPAILCACCTLLVPDGRTSVYLCSCCAML